MASSSLVPAVSCFSLVVLLWVICLAHTAKMNVCNNDERIRRIEPIFRVGAVLYLCFYTIAYLTALALITLALSDVHYFYDYRFGYKLLIIIIMIAGSMGFITFYGFSIARLYYTFKDSVFKFHKRVAICYFACSCVLAVLFCFNGATYYLFKQHLLEDDRDRKAVLFAGGLIAMLNMLVSLALVYLFSSKLIKLALLQRESQQSRLICFVSLSGRQTALISIVTKQVVLNVIAIVSFNVLIPVAILVYLYLEPHTVYTYLGTILLGFICHSIEMFCVVLSMHYNKNFYRCCCACCDHSCNHLISKITQKKIIHRLESIEDEEHDDFAYHAL